MTRSSRKLGLALALVALVSPAVAASGVSPAGAVSGATPGLVTPARVDVQEDFKEGVDLYLRGHKEEALAKFQAVLAADPSNEEAYELWKATDAQIFNDLLVEGGEYRLVTQRLLERATIGRRERQNDPEEISKLVSSLRSTDDAIERRRIIQTLAANHGEYAVPRLLPALADAGDADWRVTAMHALTEMDTDVVQPLLAALGTEDAYQRANVAMVLGYIGDHRAAPALQYLAETDADERVQVAAGQAAMKCGASGSTLEQFLRLGDDYHFRRKNVLRDFDYSRVLWSWNGALEAHPVPRALYNNELAKRAYYDALAVDGQSVDALAGIARECTDIVSKLEFLATQGEDVDALREQADQGALAVAAGGVDAIERALAWSVVSEDVSSAIHLIRTLAEMAPAPTESLNSALDSESGALRGEAAVALGRIALRIGSAASQHVVQTLGDVAGREVVRIAVVIDANADRAAATVAALEAQGVLVNHRGNGGQGLALLSRVPGLDVLIVGDGLPDMTIDQVVVAAGKNLSTADTPVVLMTADEGLGEAWSDRVAAVSSGPDDLSALEEIFAQSLTGDRAQADALAASAAETLASLALAGNTQIDSVLTSLTGPLAHRSDAVTLPCMRALGLAGTPAELAPLAAVALDGSRSEEARVTAATAMGDIFGRNTVSVDASAGLEEVVTDGEAPLAVRRAAAMALGRLVGSDHGELVKRVRVEVRADG